MQRTTLIIATLICGLALLSGCRAPGTSAPANERKLSDYDAVRDAAVLQVVFDDMLSKENSESPAEWNGDQSKRVYVSKNPRGGRVDARQILPRHDEEKWKALTGAEQKAAMEAADDLVARVSKGGSLPELRSTSGRVNIYEDAGAATQPTREDPYGGDRPSCVFRPGYSRDGRYAAVNLAFPWSGRMHSGEVTYILERSDGGWKVLFRSFTYYV